ncbi:MAG TPA: TonB-dependent receptor [Fontimonas sp.]
MGIHTGEALRLLMAAACAATACLIAPGAGASDDETPTRLDDLIVNARHRDEYAVDIPVSLSSIHGETLDALHAERIEDLHTWLPGLNVQYADPRATNFAVRGIGNNPVNEGIESSVGLYLDEVYLGRQGMTAFDLADIERVDLLRGPQGTLFGKNATAGVLHVRTRAPGFTSEAQVDAARTGRDGYRLRAAASGPLGETVAARVSGYGTREDGWLRNLHDGSTLNGVDRHGLRAQLLFDPHTDWSLRLIADWHEEEDGQGALVLTGVGPARSGYRNLEQVVARTGDGPLPLDPMSYEVDLDGDQRIRSEQGGLSAHATFALDDLQFTSISAWRAWDYAPRIDADRSPADIYRSLDVSVRQRQWSQELRIGSVAGESLDWTTGAFFFGQDTRTQVLMHFGEEADVALLPFPFNELPLVDVLNGISSYNEGVIESESGALFSQAEWHVTERFDVTAGLRGTWERKIGRAVRDPYTGARPSLLPPVNAARAELVGPYDSDDDGGLRDSDFGASGLLALAYRSGDGVLTYFSLASSEKSGGFNVNTPGSAPRLGTDALRFDTERATSAEAGIKYATPDGRLEMDATAFLMQVRGYQTQKAFQPDDQAGPTVLLTNVGEVRSHGIEWSLRALPLRGLELGFNGAWTNARYHDFTDAPCPAEANPEPPPSCDLSGEPVQGSPRWMLNAFTRYRWNWSALTAQSVDLSYGWRSERRGSLDNSAYNRLPAYGLLHAATSLERALGENRLRMSLWGRNLLDERYLLSGGGGTIGAAYTASAGMPRTIGLSIGYDW